MMRFSTVAVLFLLVALATGIQGKGFMMKEDMLKLCTLGSSLQDKLPQALETCGYFGQGKSAEGRKKGKKCPPYETMLEKVGSQAEVSKCIYVELGWVDSEGNVNQTAIISDFSSLLPAVSSGIDTEFIENCIEKKNMRAKRKLRKCRMPRYTQEQIANLMSLFSLIHASECTLKALMESCEDFGEEAFDQIVQLLSSLGSSNLEEVLAQLSEQLQQLTGLTEEQVSELIAQLTAALTNTSG